MWAATRNWDVLVWVMVLTLAAILTLTLTQPAAGAAPPTQEPSKVFIVSPWDGAFYAGQYAGAPAYVQVGSRVEPDTIVCTVEAMRAFPISAGMRGTIEQVLVSDGQMVTAGQSLFAVRLEAREP